LLKEVSSQEKERIMRKKMTPNFGHEQSFMRDQIGFKKTPIKCMTRIRNKLQVDIVAIHKKDFECNNENPIKIKSSYR
jgi:hypothetical protein